MYQIMNVSIDASQPYCRVVCITTHATPSPRNKNLNIFKLRRGRDSASSF